MLPIKKYILFILTLFVSAGISISNDERVVVLGFDGADAALVEQWMNEGHLPNLKKLADQGSFAPLTPTNPAQTPVSWSSFATGRDPGETEIFDFLKRVPGTYFPTFAMMEEGKEPFLFGEDNPRILSIITGTAVFIFFLILIFVVSKLFGTGFRKAFILALILSVLLGGISILPAYKMVDQLIPVEKPNVTNNRKGASMWNQVCTSLYDATVFRVPNTFPPEEVDNCNQISGLGVPDIRGRVGTPAYYTTDPDFIADDNKYSIEIVMLSEFEGILETSIYGPFNKLFPEEKGYPKKIDIPLKIRRIGEQLEIETSGVKQLLKEGQWGDWVELDFSFNFMVKVHGIARFHLIQSDPYIKLYMSPVHFHPADPPVPISSPAAFSKDLFDKFSFYKTMGWAIDTWSLDQEILDEEAFLEDTYFTVDKYEEMLANFLGNDDKLLVHVFMFTDRIGHLFWRLIDEDHPKYDKELAAEYGTAIMESYKKMDEITGMAMNRIDDNTTLMVVSDHGFATWRRSINYNTWLVENGFMRIYGQESKKDLEDLFDKTGDFFQSVDWSETKAYAMGLGNIYINLKGREPKGIVEPGEEYEAVKNEIIEKLEAYVDDETGLNPVFKVYRREDIYRRFNPDIIPDLRANNRPPYRVSWQTALGGMPSGIIDINTSNWSGDHCSLDPEFVKGILFTNRKLNSGNPDMIDIHPTVLRILGMNAESDLPGTALID